MTYLVQSRRAARATLRKLLAPLARRVRSKRPARVRFRLLKRAAKAQADSGNMNS